EARSRDARAFTREQEIYLGSSDPVVLAHELAHTVHQADAGSEQTLSTGTLEGEAQAGGELTAGGAAPGAVQTFLGFFEDDEEKKKAEEQERDKEIREQIKRLHILDGPTDEWKKYATDPVLGGWLRTHPDAVDPRGANAEYQAWLKDPKSKPPGATDLPKAQPVQQFDPSKPRGKGQGTGETVQDLQHRAEKTVWKSWSPKQKRDWAHGVVEAERQRFVQSMIPEKGSWEEAMWTIGEATGSYSMARAWTGETEWSVPLSGEERF